jgi:hypothetical protein
MIDIISRGEAKSSEDPLGTLEKGEEHSPRQN